MEGGTVTAQLDYLCNSVCSIHGATRKTQYPNDESWRIPAYAMYPCRWSTEVIGGIPPVILYMYYDLDMERNSKREFNGYMLCPAVVVQARMHVRGDS